MADALHIQNLWKRYSGNAVVKGIDLQIHPGEIVGLLGPNGAGKSTTIHLIAGVAKMEEGSISVFGYDNQKDYRHTRTMTGVMHQDIVIDPFFTIGQALKIHAGYYGVRDDREWRLHLIDRLALGPHVDKHMNKLSGGMKRRLMLAKALIHKPRLLILDEPTAGVDVELRRIIWDFVREMNQSGTTILLTTHYLEEAQQMCGRIAILNHGKIVALDETSKLVKQIDQIRVEVSLKENLLRIPVSLMDFSPVLKAEGSIVEFTLAGNREPDLLEKLFDCGLKVLSVRTAQPSLEEVFLKITGEQARAV